MKRRSFLQSAASVGLFGSSFGTGEEVRFSVLPPWEPGTLEIHHLAYGRGNSTFILCPDGTTILIDAGSTDDSLEVSCAQKPNASIRPGEWIANYALRQMRAAQRQELDYCLVTHLHPDHLGDLGPDNPPSSNGKFRLTGLMYVAAKVRICTLIDRGFPDYRYPAAQQDLFALNYLEFVRWRVS